MKKSIAVAVFALWALATPKAEAQNISTHLLNDTLTAFANRYANVMRITTQKQQCKNGIFSITTNDNLAGMPFRPDNVATLKQTLLGMAQQAGIAAKQVDIYTSGVEIGQLIPDCYLPSAQRKAPRALPNCIPLVQNTSLPYAPTQGLQGRHIALWGSHGYHYDQKLARWEWQRARLLQTVEDLYTSAYTIPYLTPMLENAGACVLQPRERDTQTNEVLVDDDDDNFGSTRAKNWKACKNGGFANPQSTYGEKENPFTMGGYHYAETEADSTKASTVSWTPAIPESGNYAVYIAYKTLPKSVEKVRYTVQHSGGKTHFCVNQRMGGGTWIYLGTFHFEAGSQGSVTLSNQSAQNGIVTADAVKFGGGFGNIARQPLHPLWADTDSCAETSGYPRFMEGARYWLQWAGIPDSVYNFTKGTNDYTDDFSCRGRWVNYLAGGSAANPNAVGLNIPIELSLAFHTDAGLTPDDSIVGTLTIFTTKNNHKSPLYPTGTSRYAARDLADLIQTQIVDDVRATWAPEWQRRQLSDKSYSETRVPEVPAVILELLSHQNLADMRYGQDPRFRFTVSRAVYKGILKFVHLQYGTSYTVQPLPVRRFALQMVGTDSIRLSWQATTDTLEPTATPDFYIVYTAQGERGFDNGIRTNSTSCTLPISPNTHYQFRIAAGNQGGLSMPSETLAAYQSAASRGTALIINGFDRVCAPQSFALDSTYGGFLPGKYGIPDGYDLSYVGEQYEFKRDVPWRDDDAPGFGASYAGNENVLVVGNTHNYTYLHGRALAEAGYSYLSCAHAAIDSMPCTFDVVDLILGKQKTTTVGTQKRTTDYACFSPALREYLTRYTQNNGHLLVSGAYLASDLWENPLATDDDRQFAQNVLHYTWRTNCASQSGQVRPVRNPLHVLSTKEHMSYYHTPNALCYPAEEPDGIEPADRHTHTFMRYTDNNLSAAVAYDDAYKTCVFGFPLECIKQPEQLQALMHDILHFFEN